MKYTCSAICYHWGLDKVYPQLGHHSVFLSDGFREGLDRIFRDKSISDHPSFYIHAPVRTDPAAAPANHDTLSLIVGAGHIDIKKKQDWDDLKKKTRMAVIQRLKQLGLDDIEEHIKFEICYIPENWESTCSPTEMLFFTYVAMFVIMTPLVLVKEGHVLARIPGFTVRTWVGLALLTFFHNFLSMVLFLKALKQLDAIQAAVANYLVAFFGVPIAVIWLKEKLTLLGIVGGLMVLFSTLLVTLWEDRHPPALTVQD